MLAHQKCGQDGYWRSRARSKEPADYVHGIREEGVINAGPVCFVDAFVDRSSAEGARTWKKAIPKNDALYW